MAFPRPANFPYKEVFYFDGEIALIKGRSTRIRVGVPICIYVKHFYLNKG